MAGTCRLFTDRIRTDCNILLFLASSIMNRLSETILLAKVRHQDSAEAFAELYDEYVKRVYRFVYFKVKSSEDAEDITAEVFLKTWNYIRDRKHDIKSFSGLLYKIARTSIIDWYRKAARRPDTLSIDTEDGSLDVGDSGLFSKEIVQKIEHKEILAGLEKLKHDYQEVVVLRYVEDLTIKEIAEITGKTALVVRVTLHRALKKLEQMLSSSEKKSL